VAKQFKFCNKNKNKKTTGLFLKAIITTHLTTKNPQNYILGDFFILVVLKFIF